MNNLIPYGRQEITEKDIEAVISVLKSDFLTQGPKVPEFEKSVVSYVNAKHGIAVNSATSALHIACLSLGLKSEDWLWTSPITFVASANCGLYCGAKIDFVDIDPNTYNLCHIALKEKLEHAEKIGELPKILVAVHFSGQPCAMEEIYLLSKKYNFRIIEDASHAIGAKYNGELIGNCKYSDVTVFSFHPVKIITTAEGGMAVTNDEEIAEKMRLLRSHGITRNKDYMTKIPDGPWYYQQIDLGYNYRMTDLQACLGISQMHRLNNYVLKRHKIAMCYDKYLSELSLKLPWQDPKNFSAFHLYCIRLNLSETNHSRLNVFNTLKEKNIGVNIHYIPIHLQPHYQLMGFKFGDFPEAERFYAETISLPIFPALNNDQQMYVIDIITTIINKNI